MTAASEVYSFLSLKGPTDNSNSFTNWSAADLALNWIDAKNFGIYVIALSGANLGSKGLVGLVIKGGLPAGSFVVAHRQNSKGKANDVPEADGGRLGAGY